MSESELSLLVIYLAYNFQKETPGKLHGFLFLKISKRHDDEAGMLPKARHVLRNVIAKISHLQFLEQRRLALFHPYAIS